ncbi:unnamed protein product [Arctia plantaginis]|uniref:Regulatory protein zeste n=1 Tax=Arctia plantaginis TaxID=874455 RepID=A0A8S1B9E5_ARCPL|nr:unnamed protein product [Arctia plantaginis]
MTDTSEHARHVSYEQVKSIIDFMGQHVEFASGNLRSLEARHTSKRLWSELTKVLNSCRGGTQKTSDGWSKYWSDFKNKLKNKAWLLKRKKSGSSLKGIRPLTKLEKRALVILGPYFDKKKPREVFTDTNQDPLPPEVKLETFQEIVTSDYNKTQSESSDRLSDRDDRSNSGESSGGEYVDDNESNEPVLQNLYPKWLIEVEKKRADAELIRAKAEEQRAVVAAKNSEAAKVQADALKRLAEAASLQAQAILRIATVLEARGHGDMLAI